ncbi:MAG: acetyl-CoA carboxylase biotin carboxylase subunit [Alphaproteobacteria bacterium]|nr:acetyl-CoA carboxylase biotin carboxylase subunit [Alphaproteobacteria bacterium]
MIRKVLVANRGEIALRVVRSCRELGLRSVAVYSEADRASLHARFADEAVCIGPAQAGRSYLHVPAILAAAEITEADAIHPGYGFLAENAAFAAAVEGAGLVFVGPTPEHLRLFGDKARAKEAAAAAGLPLLPGSAGTVADLAAAEAAAEAVGYPIVLKAAAGGGGKGMRIVEHARELPRAFRLCTAEADKAFGNGALLVERFVRTPRHVEVQVAADGRDAVALGTRDCTLQRRHQKLVEEAPAPQLPLALEATLLEGSARLCRSVGYRSLATVEFLVDGDEAFFLEVNPRIQVEHPVTEVTLGMDLVALQLALADGEPLPLTAPPPVRGHAIEIRINAEDPWTFAPSPGRIEGLHLPGGPGIRVDAAVHEHAVVPPYYDSLVAKIIAHGADRPTAIARAKRALDELVVEGIRTTAPVQRALLDTDAFRDVTMHTRYVDEWLTRRADG